MEVFMVDEVNFGINSSSSHSSTIHFPHDHGNDDHDYDDHHDHRALLYLPFAWWTYMIIPFVAAAIGYATNVLALQMTFYPIEYVGLNLWRMKNEPWGCIGWQGIIPSKAEKMARISFELFTKRLFNMQEIFNRLDPVQFSDAMDDGILLMIDSVIQDVAFKYMPKVWTSLPKQVRDDIVVVAHQDCHVFLSDFMKDMQAHVDDVVDIQHLTVSACVHNKSLIVKMFLECGEQEFIFIRRSGIYFGFLFGLFQMLVWILYPASWTMPVAGFIVGWFTNYVALKVIFQPILPRTITLPVLGCTWTLQGLFMKRQHEVSAIFARVIVTDILHVRSLWDAIFTGPLCSNFYAMLRAHTLVFTDKLVAEIKPLAIAALGAESFALMNEDIAQKVMDDLPLIIDHSFQYTQQALDMEHSIRTKMQLLPPAEFERVLHPAFEEDEIQLIALGGLLGAAVGAIQIVTVFA